MITNTKEKSVNKGGTVLDMEAYGIDTDNIGHLIQILRDMYSKPHEAIVREYVANGVDAHIEAGCPDTPIEVTLPTATAILGEGDTSFRVRDYGSGLNLADTKRLLFGYGASGEYKRQSNDLIGGFGIGCKCAFAIADQFTYKIWHGGLLRIWNCYLDENDIGQADLIGEQVSAEPTGIEIAIPIPEADAHRFRHSAELLKYLPVPVKVTRGTKTYIPNESKPKYKFEGAVKCTIDEQEYRIPWRVLNAPRGSDTPTCIVGGYEYPLDMASLGNSYQSDSFYKELEIELPIGFVPLAPNREALKYTKRTIRILEETLRAIMQNMADTLTTSQSVNLLTKFRTITQLRSSGISVSYPDGVDADGFNIGELAGESACGEVCLRVNDSKEIWSAVRAQAWMPVSQRHITPAQANTTKGYIPEQYIVIGKRESGHGFSALANQASYALYKHLVSIRESLPRRMPSSCNTQLCSSNCRIIRVEPEHYETALALLHSKAFVRDGSVVVLEVKEIEDKAEDETTVFNDRLPGEIVGLRFLAKYKENDYPVSKRKRRARKVSAYTRKFVTLNATSNYYKTASDYWSPASAKNIIGGVYVPIHRYLISEIESFGDTYWGKERLLWCCANLDQPCMPDTLYGVRLKDLEQVREDPCFMSLPQYIQLYFSDAKRNGTLTEKDLVWSILSRMPRESWARIQAVLAEIDKAKPRLGNTVLFSRTQDLLSLIQHKPTQAARDTLSLFHRIQTKSCGIMLGTPILDSAVYDLSDRTPQARLLAQAGRRLQYDDLLTNTDYAGLTKNPIHDWTCFVQEHYPLLGTYLWEKAPKSQEVSDYKVDFDEYVKYILYREQ